MNKTYRFGGAFFCTQISGEVIPLDKLIPKRE